MSTIETGGPAFPMARVTVLAEDGTPNEACAVSHDGMTLRDYFAAKAMQGLFAAGGGVIRTADEWASLAYIMADAMLNARSSYQEKDNGSI